MNLTTENEAVIEEIVTYINAKVNIPHLPESIEQVVIRAIILAAFHLLSKKIV